MHRQYNLRFARLICISAALDVHSTASVQNDAELHAALVDASINTIILEQDLQLDASIWTSRDSSASPYILTRNLTLLSSPPYRVLDFAWIGDGQVQLAPGSWLNISKLILQHSRYGPGIQLDFVSYSPGAVLVLWNSVIVKVACVSTTGEPDAVAVQPRLQGFPGQQRAAYVSGYCLQSTCYNNVLTYHDYTKLAGQTNEDTSGGGYAMVINNFTKVCWNFLTPDACSSAESIDICLKRALDGYNGGPPYTPGQLAQQAGAARAHQHMALIVGLCVGFGGTLLVAGLGTALFWWHRRPSPATHQRSGQKQHLLPVIAGRRTSTGLAPGPSQPSMPSSPAKIGVPYFGWSFMFCEAKLSSVRTAAAALPDALAAADKISLGVLLGAGSFGKVFKGRWRGMEVAVKVLQHSKAATADVANEVDLMMSFHHQNIVSAYHFVTWRRRLDKQQAQPADGAAELRCADVGLHSHGEVSTGGSLGAEASLADSGGPVPEMPEDTQTWIVQEFCNGGNLGDFCLSSAQSKAGELPQGHDILRLLFRLRDVADGMLHLHRRSVVHGDLKSANVLLSVNPVAPYGRTAKITDFGLSRALVSGQTHRSTHTLGTVSHMAPELLRFGKMSTAADVYSFGIMMWELMTGAVAFKGLHYGSVIERVALIGERPVFPQDAPEDYALLANSCWQAEVQARPDFGQVLQCLDIMITSRQQELAEAAATQEAATRQASGSTAEITQDLDSAACGLNRSNGRYGVGGAMSRSSSRLAAPAGETTDLGEPRPTTKFKDSNWQQAASGSSGPFQEGWREPPGKDYTYFYSLIGTGIGIAVGWATQYMH
eukprot:gene11575-11719_t